MIKLLFTVAGIFAMGYSFAQAQLGRVEFQKKDRQAIVVYTQYPTDIAEDAIMEKMERSGNVGKQAKSGLLGGGNGFMSFKGVSLPDLKISGVDFYFKVERKSRKEKDESVVYLVMGKGSDDFANSESDPELIDNAKIFMNNLLPQIEAHNLEVQIQKQEDAIKKLDDKVTDLLKDSTDLDKKMRQNILDRQKKNAELDKQRATLEAMKAKRKP